MTRLAALSTLIRTSLLVGSHVDGVGPSPLPRTAWETTELPYITIRMVRGDEEEDLQGADGMYHSLFQIEPWHRSYDTADAMRETLKSNLLGYSGAAGSLIIAGINHFGDHELYDPDREVYACLTRLMITWVDA